MSLVRLYQYVERRPLPRRLASRCDSMNGCSHQQEIIPMDTSGIDRLDQFLRGSSRRLVYLA